MTGVQTCALPISAIVIFVAIVSAGLCGQRGRDLVRGAIVGALMTVLVITLLASEVPVELRPVFRWGVVFSIVYNVVFVGAAWLLGDVLRRQGERQRALEETARQLLVEREANAQRAVTEERLRIAREVHDVVAHHVSLMGVQAGAARRIGGRDPDRVTELLSTVEDSSREAVDELRRLVGLLRAGYARAADGERSLEPLPGLGRLDRLVADTRATGLDVSLTVVGDERAVPDSVSVSAYRVVQEAVTNTIKHAHARRCAVGVEYSADAVEVSVVDDGIGTRAPAVVGSDGSNPAPNGGHGVVGMDERVALHGGRLDIGPRPEGGFGVRARFPVRNAP